METNFKKAINLVEKYSNKREEIIEQVKKHTNSETHPDFKIGDIIEFIGGYNSDILYQSEILGFDTDGDIYILWDCYWFPLRNDEVRKIKIIKK